MSYTLRLTNGKILLTLADQQSDSVSTSLTLIGKNVNAYGTDINQNFIRLLENSSNTVPPRSPLIGQLWFNALEQRMYFYNNSLQFKPVGGPIVLEQQPVGLVSGDLWIDTTSRQLKFYDGTNLITAGPLYDYTKGKSGFVLEDLIDSSENTHLVSNLYVNDSLVGIVSDSSFSLRIDYAQEMGMSFIGQGITAAPGTKFYGTAINAEQLNGILAEDVIVSTTGSIQTISGSLDINNDEGLYVGVNQDLQFYITGTNRTATIGLGSVQDFDLLGQITGNPEIHCFYFDSTNKRIGIFTNTPTADLEIAGNVVVVGDLTIDGTTTYVNTVDLLVENKNIILANSVSGPSDLYADTGGIIIKGSSDKTLLWEFNGGNSTWRANDNFDIPSEKTYRINGNTVLTANALSSSIISAPGLTSVGNLSLLNVGDILITGTTISSTVSSPIIIGSGFTTEVQFAGRKLKNVSTPTLADTADTVATKGYVDSIISTTRVGQHALTIDISGQGIIDPEDPDLDAYVIDLLRLLLPPGDSAPYGLLDNARARVLVTTSDAASTVAISDPIDFMPVNVYRAGTTSTIGVIEYQSNYVASTTVPATSLTTKKAIKQYIVTGGDWTRGIYSGSSNTVWTDGTW